MGGYEQLRTDVEALVAAPGHVRRADVLAVLARNPPLPQPPAPQPPAPAADDVFDDAVFDPQTFG